MKCVIINKSSHPSHAMNPFDQDDITQFAEYMGLKGIDTDLFYESYYQLDNEEYEYDFDYCNETY